MSHENKYRLAISDAQKRLAEMSQGDGSDLRDEIALCRLLLESAANQQSPAAVALLQTLSRLSVADLQNRLRRHDLLSREEAMNFARELCEVVTQEIKTLDGYEDVLERIAERIEHTTNRQPLQLEYEHAG